VWVGKERMPLQQIAYVHRAFDPIANLAKGAIRVNAAPEKAALNTSPNSN